MTLLDLLNKISDGPSGKVYAMEVLICSKLTQSPSPIDRVEVVDDKVLLYE